MDARVIAAEWGWTLPLLVICLGPGAGVARLFVRRLRLDAATLAAVSFAISIALYSAAATCVWLLGGDLTFAVGASAVLLVGVALWARSRGMELAPIARGSVAGGWSGLALGAVAAIVAMVQRPWFFTSSDIFYHVAAVRSLVRTGQIFVTDPIYGTSTRVIDPTSGVWHTVLAAFARAFDVEPSTLWLPAMAVGAFVLVCSMWALMRRVSGNDRVADGMTLLLLAGTYLVDLRASAYPNQVSYGLALLVAALLARAVEEREMRYAIIAGVVGFATVTMHLGSAELVGLLTLSFAVWAAVLAWVSRSGDDAVPLRAAGYPLLALAVAFVPALPVLISRFTALSGSSVIGDSTLDAIRTDVVSLPFGLHMMVPGHYLGPTWIFIAGLAACAWALMRARRRGGRVAVAAVAVAALPALLLANPLVASLVIGYSAHMARRLAKLLPFAPYVGVAWAAGVLLAGAPRARRGFVAVAAAVAAVSLACLMLFGGVPRTWPARWPGARGAIAAWELDRRWYWGGALDQARAEFARGGEPPVIAGPLNPVYQMAGLAGVRVLSVVEAHSPYHVEVASGMARRRDDWRLAHPDTPEAERYALAKRWGVEYLVFDDAPTYLLARARVLADTRYFEPVVVTKRLTVVRLR